MMINAARKARIVACFDDLFPEAGCELIYHSDYELLIAVILSAQTTDRSVNGVTPALFERYPTLEALAQAPVAAIGEIIHAIGLYQTKAQHIQAVAQALRDRFGGHVPMDKSALMSLPGVGIKTANVVRAELFKIPELAVDTHVERIAKRLYFAAPEDDVGTVEKKLRKAFPESRYIKTHHQMIHFGRYFCKAVKPSCSVCPLQDICRYYKTTYSKK